MLEREMRMRRGWIGDGGRKRIGLGDGRSWTFGSVTAEVVVDVGRVVQGAGFAAEGCSGGAGRRELILKSGGRVVGMVDIWTLRRASPNIGLGRQADGTSCEMVNIWTLERNLPGL